MTFQKILENSDIILTEGALVERLKAEFSLRMDDHLNHAGYIYEHPLKLEQLYRQYIDIGEKHNLPIMIMTPTRKVNYESVERSKFRNKNILSDSYNYLKEIRDSYKDYSEKILIGGLLGCKGDAYSGAKILNTEESYLFHKQQTSQFKGKEIDFLFAGIMPEINEATGMARAMSETNIPYIISFMIQKDGCLLDGTALSDAIRIIDEQINPNPVCCFTNCIHPTNLIEALNNVKNRDNPQLKRLMGIQANASTLSCTELNNCNTLHQDNFDNITKEMHFLQQNFGFKLFGGCCGTDNDFMEKLAKKLKTNTSIILSV